ncbi:hypothetical protein RHMOL_Rhmol07G0148400 [Rhododendron molle]|uniref:Uncharacterized protein n=1 Tax=Rhododendron molle TaxID=49168 RepID=A0ACC0N117_RHOML|nr:hypothetical protein RHMOL_Rhmol07G0148400 [Rhododendron molle]
MTASSSFSFCFRRVLGPFQFLENFKELPKLFTANTGAGTHKLAQGLASAPESQVKKLAAPVWQSEEKAGVFLATRKDIVAWVQSKAPSLAITS